VMVFNKTITNKLWNKAISTFRSFLWISTNVTHSSLRQYHEAMLPQVGSRNAHGCVQNAEDGFGLDFLEHHKDCDCLTRIERVTGVENSACTHTQRSRKPDGNCFLRQERGDDGRIHAARYHNNITSVLWNSKKKCLGQLETKAWNADIRCGASPWQYTSTSA
jgi:hypothetical protein